MKLLFSLFFISVFFYLAKITVMAKCALVIGCKAVLDFVMSEIPEFESDDEDDFEHSYNFKKLEIITRIVILRNIQETHVRVSGYVKTDVEHEIFKKLIPLL